MAAHIVYDLRGDVQRAPTPYVVSDLNFGGHRRSDTSAPCSAASDLIELPLDSVPDVLDELQLAFDGGRQTEPQPQPVTRLQMMNAMDLEMDSLQRVESASRPAETPLSRLVTSVEIQCRPP